jgi:hypothetical protein
MLLCKVGHGGLENRLVLMVIGQLQAALALTKGLRHLLEGGLGGVVVWGCLGIHEGDRKGGHQPPW